MITLIVLVWLSRFCLQNRRNFTRSILPPLTFGGQCLFFSTPISQIYAHPDLRGFLWADVFVWEGGRSRKKHTRLHEIRTPKIVSMVTCKLNKFTLDFNFGKKRIIVFVLFRRWISRPHKIHSQDFFIHCISRPWKLWSMGQSLADVTIANNFRCKIHPRN